MLIKRVEACSSMEADRPIFAVCACVCAHTYFSYLHETQNDLWHVSV